MHIQVLNQAHKQLLVRKRIQEVPKLTYFTVHLENIPNKIRAYLPWAP